MPGNVSGVVLSPQFTEMETREPSGSVELKLTVTGWPTNGVVGTTEVIVTTGGLSFTISVV